MERNGQKERKRLNATRKRGLKYVYHKKSKDLVHARTEKEKVWPAKDGRWRGAQEKFKIEPAPKKRALTRRTRAEKDSLANTGNVALS